MDVSSDLHSFGVAVDAADEEEKERLLHVFVAVDFRRDGAGQLVVKIILRNLAEWKDRGRRATLHVVVGA